jgi:hypothetical protein
MRFCIDINTPKMAKRSAASAKPKKGDGDGASTRGLAQLRLLCNKRGFLFTPRPVHFLCSLILDVDLNDHLRANLKSAFG